MKRFFAKVLTVLLTAGILFSGSSLPVMADDSATDTQVSEDSYVLPKDSYYLYIIELLDENGQPLPGNMVYYNSVPYWGDPSIAQSAYILSENDNLNTVHSTSRDLLGVDKFRLRVSIREDVELTLKKVDTPSFSEFDSFDGFEPCKAGEISEVYSFDDDRIDFYGLLSHEGKNFKISFSISRIEPGTFEIGISFGGMKDGRFWYSSNKTILTQDTKDDPVFCYIDADQLDKRILFRRDNCRLVSINGLQEMLGIDNYPLSGLDTYLTLEYTVSGESEPRTSRVIICEEGKELWKNPFTDVKDTDLFYNSLSYCYRNGLLNGTSATEFSPEAEANRAMIVTTLYRIAGSPEIEGVNQFADVPADQWYTDAVIWASQNGIVNGYDSEHFGPMDVITREQFATILYRYAKMLYPEMSLDDVSPHNEMYIAECGMEIEASDYAWEALAVAAENNILGIERDDYYPFNIHPKKPVTRADLANGLYGLNLSLLVEAGEAH